MKFIRHIVLCAGVIALAAVSAFSQTPKSGALLTITNGSSVNLKIYDSQIHTGTVRTVPPSGTNGSSCPASDLIPTDAYVLQGGAPTGCDSGDAFETGGGAGVTGTAPLGNFTITTQYLCVSTSCGASSNSTICNSNNTVCISGETEGAFVDTGFLTVKNTTGSPFVGTITLRGHSPIGADTNLSCPPGGDASDSITFTAGSPFATNDTRRFALSADSSNCGGFNAAQTLTLTQNQTSIASFGKDDYQIKPLNVATGEILDTLDVLPVPVPAGPLGLNTWGAGNFGSEAPVFSPLRFSAGGNFTPTTYACIPYADFSAANNPVCVELQLTPHGPSGGNYLYTAQNDFNIDANSLSGGVGGPAFLGHHTFDCPDSAFDINIFFSYTAPSNTFGDPVKGSGGGTGSCWVTAFDPNAGAIPTGTTFSFFEGFQSPVSDTDLNLVKPGQSIPLIFKLFSSPSLGNPNYKLCPSQTVPSDSTCPGFPGVTPPWVFFGTITTTCMIDPSPNTDTEFTVPAGGSSLQNFGDGTYQYNLKTVKGSSGCFDAVLIFDSSLTLFPANFKYKK
jgi:hypothetical protein